MGKLCTFNRSMCPSVVGLWLDTNWDYNAVATMKIVFYECTFDCSTLPSLVGLLLDDCILALAMKNDIRVYV